MFVQNTTLVDNDRVGVSVDMGVSTGRVYISPQDREADKWRDPQHVGIPSSKQHT